jgi:hypothetical protein
MPTMPTTPTADPPWLPGCIANLNKLKPPGKLCSEIHCTDSQSYWHAVCRCEEPFPNGCIDPKPNCCSYTDTSPIYVPATPGCYCCCGCFANETLIAFSADEAKPVNEFVPGDPLWVALDLNLTSWASVPVQFSSGTGPESQNTMIRVSFGDSSAPEEIFVTREQLLMVEGNRLKRASRLVPGRDQLVRAVGGLAPVLDLAAGLYQRGVHQVATSETPTTDPSGHLLVANGLVGGDFSLQVTDLDAAAPGLLVDGHSDLPEFGTKEYGERYSHLLADSNRAHPTDQVLREATPGVFELFSLTEPPVIPSAARSLFTRQQAEDIRKNTVQDPSYSGTGTAIVNYLFKFFKGFYPSVVLYLDNTADLPNVYAYRQYGTSFVIVNGGFIRTDIVQYETIAFGIAQALSHLFSGPPESKEGYTCTGAADYAALLGVFPYVWFGHFSQPYIEAAVSQMDDLFEAIDPDHRGGVPGDTCVRISTKCRQQTMQAASRTAPLPPCAGGPPPATLAVTGAVGGTGPDGTYVTVTFNEAVDPVTGQLPGSYEFQPIAPATAATLNPTDPTEVTVYAQLHVNQQYTIRAAEVLSANGNPVIPSRSRATFTIEEG